MNQNTALIPPGDLLTANETNFSELALRLFQYQYQSNSIYRRYCDAIRTNPDKINCIEKIPFLPISFFKTHRVITGDDTDVKIIFESSGTTDGDSSKHYITDTQLYVKSALNGFKRLYHNPESLCVLALLPSYLERGNSSLVYMVNELMAASGHPLNGFFLNNLEELSDVLKRLEANAQPTLLIGVTYALIDFFQEFGFPLRHTAVMETGGMKGRKTELTRAQVHQLLKKNTQLTHIHAEYGMTELLSQAYSKSEGIFSPSNTLRVLVRDINDPFDVKAAGSGCLNIIDICNINSCAFVATEDMGRVYDNGTFFVTGRMDHSALRGCSLMHL